LREHGVRVLTVREILAAHTDTNMSARVDLEELASSAMTYELAPGNDVTVRKGLALVLRICLIQPRRHSANPR
jgi:hypothetical protein